MTCAPRRVRRSRQATPSGASRRRFRIPKADVPPTEKAPAAIRRIGAAGAFPGPGPRWRGRWTGHDPRARGSRRCRGRLGPTARCRAPEARRLIPCRPTPGRGPHPTPSVSRSPWQSTKLPDGIRGRVRAVSTGPTNPPPGPPPHRDPKIATRDEPGGSSRTQRRRSRSAARGFTRVLDDSTDRRSCRRRLRPRAAPPGGARRRRPRSAVGRPPPSGCKREKPPQARPAGRRPRIAARGPRGEARRIDLDPAAYGSPPPVGSRRWAMELGAIAAPARLGASRSRRDRPGTSSAEEVRPPRARAVRFKSRADPARPAGRGPMRPPTPYPPFQPEPFRDRRAIGRRPRRAGRNRRQSSAHPRIHQPASNLTCCPLKSIRTRNFLVEKYSISSHLVQYFSTGLSTMIMI